MAEPRVLYPSVFVVDSHTTCPPVPPRPSLQRRRTMVVQTLLYMLVCLALCGMVIEAFFIYRLYHPEVESASTWAKMKQDKKVLLRPTRRPNRAIPPSKPVAHLTDGQNLIHGKQILSWSTIAEPLLYGMKYNHGKLVIEKEGYYYVYSKVFFTESSVFYHSINVETPRYERGYIPLLQSRKYSSKSSKAFDQSNSYLGGVFHLNKDDGVFVKVSNTTQVVRFRAYENYFGAYMI